ncbi:hypothetical protein BDY21DRAFT_51001 [Lineolata rhizophorae]|uniref:VASt domain-containing protein n=1 Tax=Lineolata rhizophorae TaxID=578093 RepID=A0A6A6NXC7_9PEZI|nr:hypothetical protein BDY21DRAFT_51001 [Lineolata rhizophorae]
MHKSISSSLVTDDEGDAERQPHRPSLSTHNSHTDYLTLSSPHVASARIPLSDDTSSAPTQSEHFDKVAPKHAATLAAPSSSSVKRSPSPVGRLKDAFVPTRRSTSPKVDPETESAKSSGGGSGGSGGGGGGLGGLLAGAKKGSGSSRRGSRASSTDQQDVEAEARSPERPVTAPAKGQSTPKRRPQLLPATPPNVADAPTTLITPPTPTDPKINTPAFSDKASRKGSADAERESAPQPNPNVVVSPSGNMISHRRARSSTNPPSKLSNSITAPLTPTIEEAKTPGGTLASPNTPGGFFSSVFSAAQNAAQNAANQLSTTIANTSIPGQRGRSATDPRQQEAEKVWQAGGEEVIPGSANTEPTAETVSAEKRQLAVETLGSGNLSLSHLGISEPTSDVSPMTSRVDLGDSSTTIGNGVLSPEEESARAEDDAAAKAISAAYASKPTTTDRTNGEVSPPAEVQTPPRPVAVDTDAPGSGMRRSGSVRSRISGGRKRRHRGSSATTGNTIALGLGASTSTLINSSSAGPVLPQVNGRPLTGFAVANPKRNRDFHQTFRSVPEDDYLIEDYSAALQREILVHGRLYISEGHICFGSNILGWVTNLVMSFDEVVSIEKKSTMGIIPNRIVIQTLHARNDFASFVARDSTYDLLIGIWKISHPNLKSSINGHQLDESGPSDKTEAAASLVGGPVEGSEDASEVDSDDDEVYDEDLEENDGAGSFQDVNESASVAGSEPAGDGRSVSRKTSAAAVTAANMAAAEEAIVASATGAHTDGAGGASAEDAGVNGAAAAAAASGAAGGAPDFPGPVMHTPTECGDGDQHHERLLTDTTIAAPLGKIYSLMFGPASGAFMRRWLVEDQKSMDLQLVDDGKGLGPENSNFGYSFIKPLNASIGPKQTKCIIQQTLEQFDLERAVSVSCSTQNPDVPNGNIFVVKTRYCLMWAPGNATRLVMTCTVEWSGKSWLKNPIEKGANEGQAQYAKDIVAALRAAVAKPAVTRGPAAKTKARRRKAGAQVPDGATSPSAATATTATNAAATRAAEQRNAGGYLAALLEVLKPVVEIVGGGVAGGIAAALLLVVLATWWARRGGAGPAGGMGPAGGYGYGYGYGYGGPPPIGWGPADRAARAVAYEQVWRAEEAELFRWMEERAGARGGAVKGVYGDRDGAKASTGGKGTVGGQVEEDELSELEMKEAIRIVELRLKGMKEAMKRKEGKGKGGVEGEAKVEV